METFIKIYNIEEKICDNLIKYHKLNKEYKREGESDKGIINKEIKESKDVYFYNQSKNKDILNFFNVLNVPINNYIKEFEIIYKLKTNNLNIIQHYKPNGGYKVWHCENDGLEYIKRKLVYMVYLNNVKNGGTEFKYQNIKLEAIKGNLIIWPADFTHIHRSIISSTEEKYIATGWFDMIC